MRKQLLGIELYVGLEWSPAIPYPMFNPKERADWVVENQPSKRLVITLGRPLGHAHQEAKKQANKIWPGS